MDIKFKLRSYSKEARRATFLSRLYDNFKEELAKNKEMKESLKKFRNEAEKLEQSEALKAARQKFETVEKEASKGVWNLYCCICIVILMNIIFRW